MAIYRLIEQPDLVDPVVIVALDGWVDAGSAATGAADVLASKGRLVVEFDGDALFDFRARRPTLEIQDGKPERLTWPALTMRRRKLGERDLLILTGAEPDYRWRRVSNDLVEIAKQLGVRQWISIGAIPAAVPHTRPVPILGTSSEPGLLKGDVKPGPDGLLRVPAACISVVDIAMSRAGVPSLGYFAQIPHYINGEYPTASLALLKTIGEHLDVEPPLGKLEAESTTLRQRLDTATELDESTRAYVERLESMVDEARLPAGDDLIADIERFLRDQGRDLGSGGRPN
jgi:hypothetical protein